jgi:hypothetical protein
LKVTEEAGKSGFDVSLSRGGKPGPAWHQGAFIYVSGLDFAQILSESWREDLIQHQDRH